MLDDKQPMKKLVRIVKLYEIQLELKRKSRFQVNCKNL